MSTNLHHAIETAAAITDKVIVSFSGGKDSVVTMDLCLRHFKTVKAFNMYYVPGLSFQDSVLQHYRRKGVEIISLPHFELSEMLRYGVFRHMDFDVPIVSIRDIYNYVREYFNIYWIAAGERIADSIVRRAMIKKSGSIDWTRGRFYPVADWNIRHVRWYIKKHKLLVSSESKKMNGHSFRDLSGETLEALKTYYPGDYERVRNMFPFVDAELIRWQSQSMKNLNRN